MQIECFDYENKDDFMLLMNFIQIIANGKKVFIDSCGVDIDESFDENAILASAANLHNTIQISLCLNDLSAKSVRKGIFNSRYSSIYLFNDNVSWEEFLNTHPKSERKLFQKEMLIANIIVGEMEPVIITINKTYTKNAELFLQSMNQAGYKLKKTYILV